MSFIVNDLKHLVKTSITLGLTTTSTVFLGSMLNEYTSDHKIWQDYATLGLIGSVLGSIWLFKETNNNF